MQAPRDANEVQARPMITLVIPTMGALVSAGLLIALFLVYGTL